MLRNSSFIHFTLTLLLLLSSSIASAVASDPSTDPAVGEDSDDFEELLSIDEQEDQNPDQKQEAAKFSEAEVLAKAQRIVIELNSDNTKRLIDGNEFVLVLGYAPWCPRSAELMPHFAEAATKLKELGSNLLMTKLDADRYPKVASTLEIKGFPTLLLFINGSSQPYTGGFSAEEIVIWVRKKTGEPVIRISTVAQAEEFVKKYQTFVMGLFEKFEGPNYEEFVKAAVADNEVQFVEVGNSDIAGVLFPDIKAKDSVLALVKSEPERYSAYEGTFEMGKILQFLDYFKFPLVIKLTEMNSIRVYSSPIKLQVYIFSKADEFKPLLEPLQHIARKFHKRIMLINIDIVDENLAKPFLTLFGLEEAENTVVAAFDNKDSSKFLLEADPTPSNIEDFCSRLADGTLSPYYKSEPIPDNKNVSILTVVGKTFDDLVLNSPKTVFLEVYTPWCISCETTSKQVEKLANHFKGLDSIVFARIDASANEHPKLQLSDYPALLFYKAGDKKNPIKLPTKFSSKDLAAHINKHLKAKDQVPKDEL